MEPFNLLKFLRSSTGGGGGVSAGATESAGACKPTTTGTTTESTCPLNVPITTSATESTSFKTPTTVDGATEPTSFKTPTTLDGATESNKKLEPEEKDDDGPFFDLEFTVHSGNVDDDDDDGGEDEEGDCDSAGGSEREYNYTMSSSSSCSRTDPNLSFSPSDDLFFKGSSFVQLDRSPTCSEPNSKSQFHLSLFKSATKFRIFMLRFKKSKSTDKVVDEINGDSSLKRSPKQKVEEIVPIISLFSRENSLRSSINKIQKQGFDDDEIDAEEEKKFVLQKYLKMIKPLYVRVSKRYGEKMKFSGNLGSPAQKCSPRKDIEERGEIVGCNLKTNQKQGNLPAGLKVVCKQLGKSRSASSAVAAVPSSVTFQTRRKQDDSLFQQEDGIQSAILHCKSCFNASRDSSLLSRSISDPSHEKSSINLLRQSSLFLKEKEAGKEERIC